ncbi:MAG: sporulation protein YqfD [Clostridia bacterium]|nr:sporulation protein YqfD [Clostridia bacterium]
MKRRGDVTFFLRTKRVPYLLNRAIKAGLSVSAVVLSSDGVALSVSRRQSAALRQILLEEEIDYSERGQNPFRALLARPVLLASLALTMAAIFLFGSFVYGVEITGNHYVNTSSIRAVLTENKVDGFVYKGAIDLEKIRGEIVALDGISFASVSVKGNRLYVDVKEEILPLSPEEENFAPVLAERAGVVTKIVAESGTPLVTVGDVVKEGDVLIAPVYTFTEGEAPAPAKGEVYALTVYTKEIVLPLFTLQNERTGAKTSFREIELFGRKISKESPSPYPSYDVTEKVILDCGFVRITEKTYFEKCEVTVCHDFDLEAPALIEKARAELLAEVPFHAYATGSVVAEQKKLDNMLYIVLYYTVAQRIDSLFLPDSGRAGR